MQFNFDLPNTICFTCYRYTVNKDEYILKLRSDAFLLENIGPRLCNNVLYTDS